MSTTPTLIYGTVEQARAHSRNLSRRQLHEIERDTKRCLVCRTAEDRAVAGAWWMHGIEPVLLDGGRMGKLRTLTGDHVRLLVRERRQRVIGSAVMLEHLPRRSWAFLSRRYRHGLLETVRAWREAGCSVWLSTDAPWPHRWLPWRDITDHATVVFRAPDFRSTRHLERYARKLRKRCEKHAQGTTRVCVSVPWRWAHHWNEHEVVLAELGIDALLTRKD